MRFCVGLALLFAAFCAGPAAAQSPPPSAADDPNGFVPSYRVGVDTHWVRRYVFVRESYDPITIQSTFDMTALLSAPAVAEAYHRLHDGADGRDSALGAEQRIEVATGSVAFTGEFQALVRFSTQKVDKRSGRKEPPQRWIATLGYTYLPRSRNPEHFRLNPWGFQVTSYRVDPESVAAEESQP